MMKLLMGITVGIFVGSLGLTHAQPTRQGCGWVVWARGHGQDWNANSGFQTNAACDGRRAHLDSMFEKVATKPTDLVEFACFPSDVDPRAKK